MKPSQQQLPTPNQVNAIISTPTRRPKPHADIRVNDESMNVDMYIYTHTYMFIHYMYICMCVCIYAHIPAYIYMYTYIYICRCPLLGFLLGHPGGFIGIVAAACGRSPEPAAEKSSGRRQGPERFGYRLYIGMSIHI